MAPSAARHLATAAPMPLLAPVTTITLPSSLPISAALAQDRCRHARRQAGRQHARVSTPRETGEGFCCRSQHYPAYTPILLRSSCSDARAKIAHSHARPLPPAPTPRPAPRPTNTNPRRAVEFPPRPSSAGVRPRRNVSRRLVPQIWHARGANPGPAQRAARLESRPRTPRGTTRPLPAAFSSVRAACAHTMSMCQCHAPQKAARPRSQLTTLQWTAATEKKNGVKNLLYYGAPTGTS